MTTPSDLCRTVFALLEDRRREEIAAFVEPDSLARFRQEVIEHRGYAASARSVAAGEEVPAPADGVEELDAAAVLALALEQRDPSRSGTASDESVQGRGPIRRILGEVFESPDLAHVVYTCGPPRAIDPSSLVATASLVRTADGWKLLAEGEWCGKSDWTFVTVGVVPLRPRAPYEPAGPRQRPWTERTFDNGRTVELFPAILERFRGTPARVSNLVVRVPREACSFQPDGAWSVQQHIGHIVDLDGLSDRRLDEFLAGAETLTAADMSNRATEEADYNARDLWHVVEKLYEARDALVQRLEGLDAASLNRRSHHPRLDQTMTVTDWLHFMCEHDDHHLASINRILRKWRPADVHS